MYKNDFQKYLESEKRFSAHTVKAYLKDLDQFLAFVSESYSVNHPNKISHKIIRTWLVSLVLDDEVSSNSVNRKLSTLKTYFRFLMLSRKVEINPTLKVIAPKMKKRLPEFVDQAAMNEFLDLELFEDDFVGVRNQFIIELLYQTGMRLSEMLALTVQDFEISTGTLKVLGKRNKERLVPVNQSLMLLGQDYLIKRSEINSKSLQLIVTQKGKSAYPKMVYNVVNSYLSQVSTLNKKSPHVLRHTFATHMLNNGADLNSIKEILGHANLSATQVYTHNSFEKLKSIYKQAHPRA